MSIHILESYPKHSKEIMDEYYTKHKYTFLDIAIGAIVLNGCSYLRVLSEISQRNYGYYYHKHLNLAILPPPSLPHTRLRRLSRTGVPSEHLIYAVNTLPPPCTDFQQGLGRRFPNEWTMKTSVPFHTSCLQNKEQLDYHV